jgi:hypothetical protein
MKCWFFLLRSGNLSQSDIAGEMVLRHHYSTGLDSRHGSSELNRMLLKFLYEPFYFYSQARGSGNFINLAQINLNKL